MTIKFDAYLQNVNFPDQIHLSCHFSSESESELETLNKSIRKLVSDLNQAKEDEKKKLEDEKKKLELAAKKSWYHTRHRSCARASCCNGHRGY